MDSKSKHDFINNCLRIEILQRLILEALDAGNEISEEFKNDYIDFIKEQIDILKKS